VRQARGDPTAERLGQVAERAPAQHADAMLFEQVGGKCVATVHLSLG
jgi:hypothetical protein